MYGTKGPLALTGVGAAAGGIGGWVWAAVVILILFSMALIARPMLQRRRRAVLGGVDVPVHGRFDRG